MHTIQDVIDSIINGQHEQAADQFIESGLTFAEFDNYNLSNMPGVTAKLADRVMQKLKDKIDDCERYMYS